MPKKNKLYIFLSLIFLLFIHISFSQTNPSSKRKFNDPEMYDGSKPTKGIWKQRLKIVKDSLDNIKKKIDDPTSDIR